MQIIQIDNYGRDHISDVVVQTSVPYVQGLRIVEDMNKDPNRAADVWYTLRDDNFKAYLPSKAKAKRLFEESLKAK